MREREIQSVRVEIGDTVALDHTFQTLKNYNLPGSKALFTMNKGSTKEIVALVIVPSTSTKDISHLLTKIIKSQLNFKPSVLYTDTCPASQDLYLSILGKTTTMRLGLFHLMHRIVDTMDNKCELHHKVLAKLKECFYTYHPTDEAALIAAFH